MARRLRHVAETPRQRLCERSALCRAGRAHRCRSRCSKPPAAPDPPSWWKPAKNRDLRVALRDACCRSRLRRYVHALRGRHRGCRSRFRARRFRQARALLDAGAGEGNYKHYFAAQRYCGLDLGVGDSAWDYSQSRRCGRSWQALPFRDARFDAWLNVVTLEHVREPARVSYANSPARSPRADDSC